MHTKQVDRPSVTGRPRSREELAALLDCITDEELARLGNYTPGTVETYRKRGKGPAWIRFGNAVLYPRAAVKSYLDSLVRDADNVGRSAL